MFKDLGNTALIDCIHRPSDVATHDGANNRPADDGRSVSVPLADSGTDCSSGGSAQYLSYQLAITSTAVYTKFDNLVSRGDIFIFIIPFIPFIPFMMMPIPVCRSPGRRVSKGIAVFPYWQQKAHDTKHDRGLAGSL